MKKIMLMMALCAMAMGLAACGDDDEPQVINVKDGVIESVEAQVTDTHYEFELNEATGTGNITVHNIVFTIGDRQSPALTIRIPNAKFTRTRNIITFNDTDIAPEMLRGTNFVPMGDPLYNVTDLNSVIDLDKKTFSISFKCHGGDFSHNGNIKYNDSVN